MATQQARAGRTDWNKWSPKERGTLCFVLREGQILLIEKKRGLGAGKLIVPDPASTEEPNNGPAPASTKAGITASAPYSKP